MLFGKLGKQILVSLGLGIATGGTTLAVINYYIDKIIAQANTLGDMASILSLGGLDTAISIIIGAVVTRATLSASKISIQKMGK